MITGLLGRKLGMTQIYQEKEAVPVTAIEVGPCKIIQIKTKEKDGYNAVQLGFVEIPEKKVNKPMLGHFKKANVSPMKYIKEFRVEDPSKFSIGDTVGIEIFKEGEYVKVTGISKGKGFQGIMKKHGAHGGPATHGSMFYRAPGSIGASSDPSRVFKGASMPGRLGGEKVTVRNLKIVKIEKEDNIIFVKGGVPGNKNSIVIVQKL
jgi:large subunit ribosomal protein L3